MASKTIASTFGLSRLTAPATDIKNINGQPAKIIGQIAIYE